MNWLSKKVFTSFEGAVLPRISNYSYGSGTKPDHFLVMKSLNLRKCSMRLNTLIFSGKST